MALECISSFIGEQVAGCLLRPIGDRIRNMYNFNTNMDKLKEKAEELKRRKESLMKDVEDADRQGDAIKEEVSRWLSQVDEFAESLASITNEGDEDRTKKRCFKVLSCPSLKTRCSHSMDAVELAKRVDDLLNKGVFPIVGNYNPPQRIRSRYVRDDEESSSREKIFNDVMEALKNSDIKVIGLHGMGGVGKTTLVRKVYWQLTEVHRLFDQVVMAEVSQNPDLIKVQGAIADHLGLKLQEESVDARASRLHDRLKEKKVLVILDDVWKELDLKAIGIPFGNADQRHCRILVTSRSRNVCSLMKSEKYISVEALSYDEAWILFWKTVGDAARQSEFETIAKNIVTRCGGLPVAILTVAKTLKYSDHSAWKEVSNGLENIDHSYVEKSFHSVIELSYEYMTNKEAKSLFLLCSLHEVGHPILIDHLVSYVTGLGSLPSVTKLKDVRVKVDNLIRHLKDVNLLLDDDRKDEVKVHDVIHEVAKSIASRDKCMFNIQDVADLTEELEKDTYKDPKFISLQYRDVPRLPEMLDFPQLKLFLLHSQKELSFSVLRRPSLIIPDHFFDRMTDVRVLCLNRVQLYSFNPLLNCLMNVRTLSLEQCHLKDITKVGKLEKLEILSFSYSNIEKLPEEIGDLRRLKLLRLEYCVCLKVIPPNVLSRLTKLEELYMVGTLVCWDTQENASLAELKQLDRLTVLDVQIVNPHIIPEGLFQERLERCKLSIGYGRFIVGNGNSRILDIWLPNKDSIRNGVKFFLKKIEELHLHEIKGLRNVYPELSGERFLDLKCLNVEDGLDILNVIKQEEHDSYNAFPMLESLSLRWLPALERICQGHLRADSFCKLKIIKVVNCGALTHLILSSADKIFMHLQKVEVMDCEVLEKVFDKESDEDNVHIKLPKLQSIRLEELPKLTNFGPTAGMETSEIIPGNNHEDLMTLFGRKVSFSSLKDLNLSSLEIQSLWRDRLPTLHSFGQTLTSLIVKKCGSLKFLFSSSSAVIELQQLENLEISNCKSMVEIINIEGPKENDGIFKILCPKLKCLELKQLRKLTRFASSSLIEFPSLKRLQVEGCPNLKSFLTRKETQMMTSEICGVDTFFDEKIVLTALEELELSLINGMEYLFPLFVASSLVHLRELKLIGCDKMIGVVTVEGDKDATADEIIFPKPERSSSAESSILRIIFPKLTRLYISDLRKLKNFCHGLHVSEWPSLKELTVENCDNVEIFGSEIHSLHQENKHVQQPLFIVDKGAFPRLEYLNLFDNRNLKETWHGGFSEHPLTPTKLRFGKHPKITSFPSILLNGSPALETFDVSFVHFKQIVSGCCHNTYADALSQLRVLSVTGFFDRYSETSDSLTYLMSSWVSFQNLTELKIDACSEFKYLLTYPTAKSLHQLTKLKISNCEMIEEIIIPPTDEVNDKIIFSKLEYLSLDQLPSLTSFYLGNHTLEFPSLQEVIVMGCTNMKIFSKGRSVTPEPQGIQHISINFGEHWEGDLNSTIQKMFKDMAGFKGLTSFKLSSFPHLKEIWHGGQLPLSFDSLCSLTVDKCADISSAITVNILLYSNSLKTLESLHVEDCDSLEEVFHLEGLDDLCRSWLLPCLDELFLIELPQLRNIWSKRHIEIFGFTFLKKLFVSKCNNLQFIFTTSIILGLNGLRKVIIEDCNMLETIINADREKDADTTDSIVLKLESIVLESLPNLKCFYSGSHVLECSSSETFTVTNCRQDGSLFNKKVVLSGLKELKLSKLPKVEHLWNEPCKAFQDLETIQISQCVNSKSLVPSSASLQNLVTLEVSQCDGLTSLMTLPTAKCLKELTRIDVIDCKIMEEIITYLRDEENDQVGFGELKYIGFHCLPNITGFYLGDSATDFPALEQVVVIQCPKMNTFSKRVVSTPKLKRVQTTKDEEEGHWQNDLNTTIQLLFKETHV